MPLGCSFNAGMVWRAYQPGAKQPWVPVFNTGTLLGCNNEMMQGVRVVYDILYVVLDFWVKW